MLLRLQRFEIHQFLCRLGKGLEVHEISLTCFTALAADEEEKFISKACAALVNAIPSLASEPESQLRGQVKALVNQARNYGMKNEEEIAVYLTTAGLMGVEFVSRFRGARDILEGRESGARKAELLEGLTIAILEALEQ